MDRYNVSTNNLVHLHHPASSYNNFRNDGNCLGPGQSGILQNDNFDDSKDKLWYRKLKNALSVVQDDLYQKSIKVDAIRRDVSAMKSRSSKLILKEVDSKLTHLKGQLANFTSFLNDMNELEIKYEAIVYDIDRDKSPNNRPKKTFPPPVNYPSNTYKSRSDMVDSSPNRSANMVTSSPVSYPSTPQCDDSDSSPLRRNTSFEEGLQAAVIKTPIKDISEFHGYASPCPNRSKYSPNNYKITPRKSVPRRRVVSQEMSSPPQYHLEPPSESGSSVVDELLSEDVHVKEDVIYEELINHPVLHEKLAQTINKVFNGENIPLNELNNFNFDLVNETDNIDPPFEIPPKITADEGNVIEANEIQLPDTAIQDILKTLEGESVWDDLINICSTKNNILGSGSQFSTPSKPLNTPKSNESGFKTPLSTPVKSSHVVKNLLNDLQTPEKKQPPVPSSPLSAAINSAINDSHFNITQSSTLMPAIDLNVVQSSQSVDANKSSSNVVTPLSHNGNVAYTYVLSANTAQEIGITLPKIVPKGLPKNTFRNKRINVDRIEKSNIQGLKRKLIKMDVPVPRTIGPYRKIAPKQATRIEQVTVPVTSSHPPYSQRIASKSSVRVNLQKKFEETTNSPSPPVIDAELLKNMNVDQFLSKVHDV